MKDDWVFPARRLFFSVYDRQHVAAGLIGLAAFGTIEQRARGYVAASMLLAGLGAFFLVQLVWLVRYKKPAVSSRVLAVGAAIGLIYNLMTADVAWTASSVVALFVFLVPVGAYLCALASWGDEKPQ